jgi:hypothetical protein
MAIIDLYSSLRHIYTEFVELKVRRYIYSLRLLLLLLLLRSSLLLSRYNNADV